LELLPDLRGRITPAANIMSLWIELLLELKRAYQENPPDNQLIAKVYRYAQWCEHEANNPDAMTAVSVAFYEHLPTNQQIREDLPNRLSKEEFLHLKALFQDVLRPSEYEVFEREFFAAGKQSGFSAQ
jgi:hypothetical protein